MGGGRVTNSWFVAFIAGLEVHNVTHDWMTACLCASPRPVGGVAT